MRIVVFGGGMQGRVIAKNLAEREEKPEVVIADLRVPGLVPPSVQQVTADVLDGAQVRKTVEGADAAVLAVPSEIARDALANLIETGIAVADVSFTPNPPTDMHEAAKDSGACCVVDCGIAPGLSHILVGRAHAELGGLDSVRILVGGLPQVPPPVFRHAVYFNASDLIAEYVRPARAREDGRDIAPAPLEVPVEPYDDQELGRLEAFLSDGLRSLMDSYPDVPNMRERTLRWPGHLETMETLRELGLLGGPGAAATAATLANQYPAEKYPDLLLMVVEAARGKERRVWRLVDRCCDGVTAMSRTTGFTTAAVAMLLARRQFAEPGVHPPERLGRDAGITSQITSDLAERGIKLTGATIAPAAPRAF